MDDPLRPNASLEREVIEAARAYRQAGWKEADDLGPDLDAALARYDAAHSMPNAGTIAERVEALQRWHPIDPGKVGGSHRGGYLDREEVLALVRSTPNAGRQLDALKEAGMYQETSGGYRRPLPIASVLLRQASQENCDGEPYDAMQFAGLYINRLLARVEELESSVPTRST